MLEQPLPSPVRFARALDFAAAAGRLGHESLGRFQDNSAFLFQLFPASRDHLIVLRFLDALFDKLLANILFVFAARGAVTGGRRYDVPFLDYLSVVLRFLRRAGCLRSEQLSTRLVPIRVRKLIRVPFGDERNFARPFLHRIG